MKNSLNPKVSVIVTTKNNENTIKRCLLSIEQQTFSEFELIVVDNFSTDQTFEIATQFTDKAYQIGPERSQQRNLAIEKSLGEYCFIVDSDMILSNDLLERINQEIETNPQLVSLTIEEEILGTTSFHQMRRFENLLNQGTLVSAPRVFKKSIFNEIGGYDDALIGGEDWDLARRLKAKGLHVFLNAEKSYSISLSEDLAQYVNSQGVTPNKSPIIYHDESALVEQKFNEKKQYYASTTLKYAQKWDNDIITKIHLNPLRRAWHIFTRKPAVILLHPIMVVRLFLFRIRSYLALRRARE